jgi:predicted MFS family arabinose efflux permease
MARIVGPGIAGLIIARLGEAPLFLLNAISFIPVVIGLAMIDISGLHAQPQRKNALQQNALQSVGEGLVYVWKTPVILLIIAVIGTVSLFGVNFNVTLPLVATEVLHAGAEGFGFISSTFGLGALIAALWLAWGNKKPSINQILISAISFSVTLGLFAISRWYPLSLLLVALTGFAQINFMAIGNTTLQTVTPNYLRGRIMSVYMLVFNGSTPIGNLFTGVLAHSFGISVTIVLSAGLSLIAAVVGWIKRAPALDDMEQTLSTK